MTDHLTELKKELVFLNLYDKAREIYNELGERAVVSYIRSSHRLLSKVYHPDLNPENLHMAVKTQQSLNRLSILIGQMEDSEIIGLFDIIKPNGNENHRKKILVVEDEFGLQEIFKDIFRMEGYEVRVAVDGVNGFEIYKQFLPDLVFTDVVMPKMSGIELVSKIREITPDIKVIYISGFFGIRRLREELDEDIVKYRYPTLAKPFKTSEMLELVKAYLSRS
ncbi:MAG: response regulator [Deltaproteobacteria bacterium]|nr:response regulator [Deltaproteobacteria bacterium]